MTGIWFRVCILMMLGGMIFALVRDNSFLEQMFRERCYLFIFVRMSPWLLAPGIIILLDSARRAFQPDWQSPLHLTNAEQIKLGVFFLLAVLAIPCSFVFLAGELHAVSIWVPDNNDVHILCSQYGESAAALYLLRLTALTLAFLPPILYLVAAFAALKAFLKRPLTLLRWHFNTSTLYYISICALVASILFEDLSIRNYIVLCYRCSGFH